MSYIVRFRIVLAALCCCCVSVSATAQTAPEITRGLQWLVSQIQADGSLFNEPQSIATTLQTRTEAAQTLKLLATTPPSLTARIDAEPEANTEYLSRKIVSLATNGWDTLNYADLLLQRQNPDGGFGGAENYASNVLDTAWAVLALAQTNKATGPEVGAARAYLAGRVGTDGSILGASDWTRIQDSAFTLLALQTTPDASNANPIQGLTTWLLQRQEATGGWAGNTYLSALVLGAISPVTADDTVRSNASGFLIGAQAADGSWGGDPFLTALVLRALATKYTSPVGFNSGTLKGQVVDAATNTALPDVTVTIAGQSDKSATTDSGGNFVIVGLSGATYSVNFLRAGYSAFTGTYSILAGQVSEAGVIGLAQLPSAVIVRGQISLSNSGAPATGATVAISGAGSASAVTDSAGRYELSGVTPGALTITASLTGYQTVTATANAIGGQTIVFSPTLYPDNQTTPSTVHYFGKVVSSGQGTPLAGVTVQIAGTSTSTATSAATGQFDFVLGAGSYTATFTMAGYEPVMQTFVAPAGATVDGGTITLVPTRTTSRITGRVTTQAGVGIAGAVVQVTGTSSMATTGADGAYAINDLAGTSFNLRASAAGYSSQLVNLQLIKPADIAQDFSLTVQSATSLALSEPTLALATVSSNADVVITTEINNTGTAPESVVVQLLVYDGSSKIIGGGLVYDMSGNLIGQVTLDPGQQQAVKLVWNSGQFPPGDYRLNVRLVEAGSITKATPQGNLLVERVSTVTVVGQAHFTGTITANPPVLQAGTSTTVKLSAVVQNNGNVEIAAQPFTLKVVDATSGNTVVTQQVDVAGMTLNGLQSLSFNDWLPASAGNYRLELTAADPLLGKVVGSLYVGDAARATYTVNKLVVPAGTQTVRASVNVTGQDIVNGTISDPLAPLVKTAIQKSVTYNDQTAAAWTYSNQCIGCHVQTQALVGGEQNRRFATFDQGRRNAIYNILTTHQKSDGSFYDANPQYRKTSSMLAMWALDAWHDKQGVASTQVNGADYLVSQQLSDGRWDYEHPWMGSWTSAVDHTALNLKSLAGLHKFLADIPADMLRKYSATSSFFSNPAYGSYSYLGADQAGNLYFPVIWQGLLLQIKPDGTIGETWSGLNEPRGVLELRDGSGLLVSTTGGVYRLTPGGGKVKVNGRSDLEDLNYGPDGLIYSPGWTSNAIYRLDENFVDSVYVQNSALATPARIAFMPNGEMLVTSYNGLAVWQIKADKTLVKVLAQTAFVGHPTRIARYRDGWLLGTTEAIYQFNDNWEGNFLLQRRADDIKVLANGKVAFVAYSQPGIWELVPTAIDAQQKRDRYAQAIDKATTWLQTQNLQSGTDNLKLAHQLIGLGEAARFYANDATRRTTIETQMTSIANTLKSRQRSDGSWGVTTGHVGDSFVTAHVGYALDYLNPSPDDPYVRKAVQWLLSHQQADGSWPSENGIFSTHLAATTWVSIWLPVILDRLGGIDTDLTVTFPANVMMSNPDRAPASTVVNNDGSTTVRWSMTGVTSAGQTISYDLSLQDMSVDELRPVSTDAHLTFKNTFTDGVVDAPIEVPRVKASAFLGLGVATDKVSYTGSSPVGIIGQVTNTGENLAAGKVKFDLYAPNNTLVATAGTIPFNNLAVGASINLSTGWNTGSTLVGTGYYVLGTLYDSADRFVGTAQSRFNITGSGAGSTLITTNIGTDKQTYQPSETVNISDRITNTTSNALLNDLRVITKVLNPDGTLRFTANETLVQLAQSNLKDYGYALPLGMAPAGQYSATLAVTSADGTLLAQSSTSFTVASTADSGSGLTATISAVPNEVPQGNAVVFDFNASNAGNSMLPDLQLKVSIVDPVAQAIIAEYPYSQPLAIGATYSGSTSWTSSGPVGKTYVAVLSATFGTKSLTLAQTNFTVVAPPVKLDVHQDLANAGRVLVLVSCNDGENDLADSGGQAPVCITQRSQAIDQLLTLLGVTHAIVTNEDAFKQAFRSGIYNTYWLSGKQDKLHGDLASELREAVFGGGSLIQDGVHDERNRTLDEVAGIRYRGKHGQTDLPVSINGPLLPAGESTATGRSLKLDLNGGVQQAVFAGSMPNTDGPAIVTNTYGAGHALLFAFDLVSSQQAHPDWQGIFNAGMQATIPSLPESHAPGGLVQLKTSIANLAQPVELDVKTALSSDAMLLGSTPTGSYDTGTHTIDWAFSLAEAQTKDLFLTLRVPDASGDFTLTTTVNTIRAGKASPYGEPLVVPIHITTTEETRANVTNLLNAYVLTRKQDQKVRDGVLASLQEAMADFSQQTAAGYEAAIGVLVDAIEQLSTLDVVNTSAAHDGLSRILKEAEWRWASLQSAP